MIRSASHPSPNLSGDIPRGRILPLNTWRHSTRSGTGFPFPTASIRAARAYFMEFKRQQEGLALGRRLSVGIVYSYAPNADAPGETLADEAVAPSQLTADDPCLPR